MLLVKFLYHNLKGLRFLIVLAIVVAVAQVSCDIIAIQPLKWIPSKAQNPGNDPACYLPFLGLNDNPGLLNLFDTPVFDPSLNPPAGGHQVQPPPTSPCPANPAVPIGLHPPFGDDVGHIQFDPVTQRVFVTTLPLNDQNLNLLATPPSFLAVIDPVTLKVVSRIQLPSLCLAPHGVVIDVQQREAFVACVDSQNLARVDLQTMQPFPGPLLPVAFNPDIVRLDHPMHLLFIGCAGSISIFDESGRGLKPLGNYFLGGGSHHTIAIDEVTQLIYLPQPSVGDRPILRVIKYVPTGI